MSWFDTTGLASLAKNALKEAQKHIDKALDIQDEEMNSSVIQSANADGTWGSFTGSFFDNPKSIEMVTTPPKSATITSVDSINSISPSSKRESMHSNSDSMDFSTSPPTSSSVSVFNSESTEIINTNTSVIISPTNDISSEDILKSPSLKVKSPDGLDIIGQEDGEDEDSISFNTVMNVDFSSNIKLQADSTILDKSSPVAHSICFIDANNQSVTKIQTSNKSTLSIDESFMDSQTVLSDSTQSFENVQIPENIEHTLHDERSSIMHSGGNGSDPTSADEIETTTSSDIEIISNPNGDSSSTHSACRITPVKHQNKQKNYTIVTSAADLNRSIKKGHCRGASEISIQSEDSQSEMDKLLRRISELNEIIENREIRLLDISRQNSVLMEQNVEFKSLLDTKQKKTEDSEEHTQRLSALEKKFQASIRERDALRDQLNTIRNELSSKIPKDDLNKMIAEKDFMIEELRTEGEKLAKNILQHSNIIKKLRAKEKDSDLLLKKNKEQFECLTDEVERLKKSLTAKEEVERSQIEAINKLCSAKQKLEKENLIQKSQIEDLNSKLETVITSFDAAKKELAEKLQSHNEMIKKADQLAALENERNKTKYQNKEMLSQLEEMREKIRVNETENSLREQKLRHENAELLKSLEDSEQRSEKLTQDLSFATVPLVRQLETLQSTLTKKTSSWEKLEEQLHKKLKETETKLETLKNIELQLRESENTSFAKIKKLEDQLQSSLLKYEQVNSDLQQNTFNFDIKESTYKKNMCEFENKLEDSIKQIEEHKKKISQLENERISSNQIENTKKNIDICKVESHVLLEGDLKQSDREDNNQSPTLSLERNSLTESNHSAWQMDDLDVGSNSGHRGVNSLYEFGLGSSQQMSHSTAILENLQSSLKQKDGELSQIQWENSRLKSERNVLNSEISNLTLDVENLKEKMASLSILEKDFSDLKHQYDALLQMYGEKVEETQELELDLQDVKEMYKAQIDELLKQQKKLNM